MATNIPPTKIDVIRYTCWPIAPWILSDSKPMSMPTCTFPEIPAKIGLLTSTKSPIPGSLRSTVSVLPVLPVLISSGIPEEIRTGNTGSTETVERRLPGIGDFVEVSSPILAGISGNVHVGMDMGLLSLRIQGAIGQQVYLITSIFVGGIFVAIWLMGLAAKPIAQLLSYAVRLAGGQADGDDRRETLLARDDEVGHLARLFLYFSEAKDPNRIERATAARPDPDMSGALSG